MNKILGILFAIITIVSCTKRDRVDAPDDFMAFTDKHVYRVGDTVSFRFTGGSDNIVFWSGKEGNNYDNRSRTEVEGNTLALNFKSFSQFGEVDKSIIRLLVSNDFSGVYDSASIRAATWINITDRATWSSGADQTPSGELVLDEFVKGNKSLVFAFQYKTTVVKPITLQNRWVIRSFDLNSRNPAGQETSLLTMGTAGWARFNFAGDSTNWEIFAPQIISMRNLTELDDDWILTRQVRPNAVAPDRGEAIKNISGKMPDFKAAYDEPGIYKVVFEATNASLKESKKVLRELTLIIEP